MRTTSLLLAVVGLVFIVWPKTGAVAISWLIAAAAIVVGGLLVYLATSSTVLDLSLVYVQWS